MCTSVRVRPLQTRTPDHGGEECLMMLRRNTNLKESRPRLYGKGYSFVHFFNIFFFNTHTLVMCSFMLTDKNGLVSLVTSVLAAPEITLKRTETGVLHARVLRISSAQGTCYP